jgi:hypothetical protein
MDVALRQRLDGVADISISQSQQTAEVTFDARPHAFSTVAFREAVGEAEVEVLHFELDVCGVVVLDGDRRWLTSGMDRFLLTDGEWAAGRPVCVTGRLAGESGDGHLVIEGSRTTQ